MAACQLLQSPFTFAPHHQAALLGCTGHGGHICRAQASDEKLTDLHCLNYHDLKLTVRFEVNSI